MCITNAVLANYRRGHVVHWALVRTDCVRSTRIKPCHPVTERQPEARDSHACCKHKRSVKIDPKIFAFKAFWRVFYYIQYRSLEHWQQLAAI